MLHTTFARAKEAGACIESYKKMAKALGGIKKYGLDTPIPLDKVLEVCGLDDALWTLRIVIEPADREIRLYACDCAERVLPLFEKEYPEDKRPRQAIEVSRRFANGQATQTKLEASWAAAWAAADARAASAAARAASAAARAASAAARAASAAASWAAADARAASAASWAAADARAASRADAAWAAERDWQKEKLLEMLRRLTNEFRKANLPIK